MQIISGRDIDRVEWGRLVEASATGTWFQTPEAYDFFASQQELFTPFAFAVVEKELRGVCCGYVTVDQDPIKQFFTRRAIIMGGPALADDCTDAEAEALMKAVRKKIQSDAIYIETRNFNSYEKWKGAFAKAGFEYQKHLNFHVDCTDTETMWNRMSDNRKRQVRHVWGMQMPETGVPQQESISEQDIRNWYMVLEYLYRTKVRTPLWPVSFFIEAYRQGIARFMLIRHEGTIIGGSMVVEDAKAVYEWFECGLNAEYKDLYPSVTATYAGMAHAAKNGIPRYDMMGAGMPGVPYGVRDFKVEFGGREVEHGRFLHVERPLLYKIGRLGIRCIKYGLKNGIMQ